MARKKSEPASSPRDRLSAVHMAFFEELNAIARDTQQHFADLQNEYQKAMLDSWPSAIPTEEEAARAANEEYQKACQSVTERFNEAMLEAQKKASDPSRHQAAYETYKSEMLKVLAEIGSEALDANTMLSLGQSFYEVAQAAAMSSPAAA